MYQSTHTGAQVDEAVDKVLASPISMMSNRNLLDNWYFVGGGSQQGGGQFPINQRGNTSYSGSGGGYLIDRWKRINSIICSLQSDCLQITNTNWGLRQVVGMPPGTYTFSMLARKLTYPSGGGMGFNSYHNIGSDWEILGNDWGLYKETFTTQNDLGNANLQFNANLGSYSIEILAMKLELGDTQTLAHKENGVWVLNDIPNYAEELAKCQRYYWDAGYSTTKPGIFSSLASSTSGSFSVYIPTPVSMRLATPTISAAVSWVRGEGSNITGYSLNTTNAAIVSGAVFGISLDKSGGYAALKPYYVAFSKLTVSCDL